MYCQNAEGRGSKKGPKIAAILRLNADTNALAQLVHLCKKYKFVNYGQCTILCTQSVPTQRSFQSYFTEKIFMGTIKILFTFKPILFTNQRRQYQIYVVELYRLMIFSSSERKKTNVGSILKPPTFILSPFDRNSLKL